MGTITFRLSLYPEHRAHGALLQNPVVGMANNKLIQAFPDSPNLVRHARLRGRAGWATSLTS